MVLASFQASYRASFQASYQASSFLMVLPSFILDLHQSTYHDCILLESTMTNAKESIKCLL